MKTGRTHLMDAMPVTVKQELQTWAMQLQDACGRVARARDDLLAVPQGGTAVGSGINAHPDFADTFARHLAEETDLAFRAMPHPL